MVQFRNTNSQMETETIQKNEASPKSQTSRRNILTIILCIFFIGVIFSSCKKDEPKDNGIVGRWNAEKAIFDSGNEISGEDLQYTYFKFNSDGTCVFNVGGSGPDSDITATYVYANNTVTLILPESGESPFVLTVKKLSDTELVLSFPPSEKDEGFTIYYKKV